MATNVSHLRITPVGCQGDTMGLCVVRMAPTKQVGLRLAPDVVAWLQAKADADQRSLAFVVMALVREQMAREAKSKKAKAKS